MRQMMIRILAVLLCGLALSPLAGQTVLISPSGDGGFETGSTFAANGWSTIGNNQNQYQIGTAPGQYEGNRCAFISRSADSWESRNQAAYRHLYRNVSFPAGETEIRLSFWFKSNIAQATPVDGFTVWLTETGVTPSTGGYPNGALLYPNLIYGAADNTWYLVSMSIPATHAGSNKRLVFSWYNDNAAPRSVGALDNIELSSQVPSTVSSLPYSQDFEAITPVGMPSGWSLISSAANRPWMATANSGIGAHSGTNIGIIYYSATAAKDEWMISPPVQVTSGNSYRIKWWTKAPGFETTPEKLKLHWGTSPSVASFTANPAIYDNANMFISDWTELFADFTATSSGTVYFGWHAYSAADVDYIAIDDVSIQVTSTDPLFAVQPSSHSFPDAFINYVQTQQFTITNNGSGTLQIVPDGITISGSNTFKLAGLPSLPLDLAANQSVSFWVLFQSPTPGSFSADLVVTDNLSKSVHYIPLSGSVTDNTVSRFPYIEGFEENIFGWMTRDADGDGYFWYLGDLVDLPDSGAFYGYSSSWIEDTKARTSSRASGSSLDAKGPLTPDNWLISPPFVIGEGYSLTWQVAAQDPDWPAENYSLLVSTTTPAQEDFGVLFSETLDQGGWQYREQSLAAYNGETIYLAFRHHDCTDQFMLKLDEIKVLAPNTEINQSLIASGAAAMTINPIQDLNQNLPISVGLELANLSSGSVITADVGYGNPSLPIVNAGMHVNVRGADLAGSIFTVHHNLGFVPQHAAWRIVPGGWNLLNPLSPIVLVWNDTSVSIQVPAAKADGDFEMIFPISADDTLPVELSHFSVSLGAANGVQITWVSQSESNLVGYQVYRGTSDRLAEARKLDDFVPATNTSQQQVYVIFDREYLPSGTYYYWLEHLEMDGGSHYHGPVSLELGDNGPSTPELPVIKGISSIYPNPFNPETNIRFGLSEASGFKLRIYNARGQLVRDLASGDLPRGYHTIKWNGRDERGASCASGIYFLVMTSGRDSFKRKLVIMK